MKKLLILATAIVTGVAANAASFKWSAANVYDSTGAAKFTGSALIYATGVAGSIATATVTSGTLSYTGNWAAAVVGNDYDFYFVIEDNGKTFTSATKTAPAQATTTQTVAFGNQTSATQNPANWVGSSPVPEPTSGLLFLLGVAGLALKRKRA